jgi:hypothetical protein
MTPGEAPEKSNISANIRKKSKSSLGLPTGARRSCLKKKNRGEKSGGTVPLSHLPHNISIRQKVLEREIFEHDTCTLQILHLEITVNIFLLTYFFQT